MSNPDWRYRMEDVGRGYGETYEGSWSGGVGAGPGYTGFGHRGYGPGDYGPGGFSQGGYGPGYPAGAEYPSGPGLMYGYVVTTTFVGRGPRSYRRSDARIEEDVNEELTRHPDLDAGDIEVKVENGEVTLTGTVDSRRSKRLAEDLAERCAGVADVHNRLTVKRGLGQRVSEMLTGGGSEQEKESGVRPRGRSSSRPRGRKGSGRSR